MHSFITVGVLRGYFLCSKCSLNPHLVPVFHSSSVGCILHLLLQPFHFLHIVCSMKQGQYVLALSGVSEVLVVQSCPMLCDPMDCSTPGSSVHGILQARTLEWLPIPFSRGPSQPRDQTRVSCIAGRGFTI